MDRKLVLATILAMAPSVAMAGADGSCGVGSKVWDSQKGVAPQVLAMTTNGTFFQTFAVSSGTSGCKPGATVRGNWKMGMFLDGNREKVARDMSLGYGETLDSMASIMEMDEAHKPVFFRATKENFAKIFPSTDVTVGDVMASLREVLAADSELAQYATAI